MKYTFEIMKEYEDAFRGISVYSVSEDKKLMVDFVALEELEDAQKEIDEAYQRGINDGSLDVKQRVEEAYQKGLDEAWKAARKISVIELNGGLTGKELMKIYGTMDIYKIYDDNTASEAIAKLKAYEEKQGDKFKFGDEIIDKWGTKGCVVSKDNEEYDTMYVLFDECRVPQYVTQSDYHKTGKHYDIEKILEGIKHD